MISDRGDDEEGEERRGDYSTRQEAASAALVADIVLTRG